MVGLLRFAADRCSRFVIASSQAVYGDPGSRSVDEDFALDPGDSAYGCSKVNAENWARSFQIRHGGCYLALRLCGFVDGGGLVDYVVDRALKGSPVELFAKGAVCRDYLPSAEGVDALLAATRCPAPEGFMPLNVGSGQALSARQVAEIAIGALGSRSEITLLAQPAPQRDMVFSVERARRVLGFAPGDLAEGVRAHALARAAAPPTEAPR
jgi:UDP-glucose 4-epimerase